MDARWVKEAIYPEHGTGPGAAVRGGAVCSDQGHEGQARAPRTSHAARSNLTCLFLVGGCMCVCVCVFGACGQGRVQGRACVIGRLMRSSVCQSVARVDEVSRRACNVGARVMHAYIQGPLPSPPLPSPSLPFAPHALPPPPPFPSHPFTNQPAAGARQLLLRPPAGRHAAQAKRQPQRARPGHALLATGS